MSRAMCYSEIWKFGEVRSYAFPKETVKPEQVCVSRKKNHEVICQSFGSIFEFDEIFFDSKKTKKIQRKKIPSEIMFLPEIQFFHFFQSLQYLFLSLTT